MNRKLFIRKLHRYMALFISVQLLAWTIGGIYFSWTDIDEIHGDHLRKTPVIAANSYSKFEIETALSGIEDFNQLISIQQTAVGATPAFELSYMDTKNQTKTIILDALTHQQITVDQDLIRDVASQHMNFTASIKDSSLMTETDSHHEYRGKSLPVWAVSFDDNDKTIFYFSPQTAKLISVRHDSWRIFDFLWMLHTMDYQGRDDFGNWLLKSFSILALISALSGIVLFVISSMGLKRRKR